MPKKGPNANICDSNILTHTVWHCWNPANFSFTFFRNNVDDDEDKKLKQKNHEKVFMNSLLVLLFCYFFNKKKAFEKNTKGYFNHDMKLFNFQEDDLFFKNISSQLCIAVP